jgi:dihydroflavonol-4-reductase
MSDELTVVTGATGHIGATLTRTLRAKGRRVRALVLDDAPSLDGVDVERVRCDVRDRAQVDAALAGARVVYHLAGIVGLDGEPTRYDAVNVAGTRNVVEACLAHGVRRLVHFSSVHAMDLDPPTRPVDETRPLVRADHPLAYPRSKGLGERDVWRGVGRGLDAVVIAPTAVVGPGDHGPSEAGRALLDLYNGRWPVLLDCGFDWVDVRDVVAGAIAAAERAPRGAKYVLSGAWASFPALGRIMAEVTGRRPPSIVLPGWSALGVAHVVRFVADLLGIQPFTRPEAIRVVTEPRLRFDHGRARRDLGYSPRPLRETVADLFACFRARGVVAS